MGKCKYVTKWQKGAIVFGRADGDTVSEVSGFVGVSLRTVQRVYKQCCNTRSRETRRQNCSWSEKDPALERPETSFTACESKSLPTPPGIAAVSE
ncbi:hypothetical protein AVEN_151370-1 [Araneus ventricosus]|uniref:Uncharacterized protein n=1 Tax=Araneus ventricosus TaxID=182803 RepID=A0A4Y2CAT2_ARAVE|nr:hypothetical protein AVEN_151370-1 [Araneus ventricosus]